jgi:phosphatidylcholine synthase
MEPTEAPAMPTIAVESLDEPEAQEPTPKGRVLSSGVHLLTASGAVVGVLALLAIAVGDFTKATLFMMAALTIDSVDGSLARVVGVTRHLPQIDGRRMDDMVDYLNFVIVPAVFMVMAGSVLSPMWVALPVLASAWGFSREDAKTDDDFFLGFPSYWNILAIYLWLLGISPLGGTLWVVALSIAVFVPYKFIYPSKLANRTLRYSVSYLGLAWCIVLCWAVLDRELAERYSVIEISLVYPALYMGLSAWLGGLQRD